MSMKFTKTPDPNNRFDNSTVQLELPSELSLTDVLEGFTDFLRGCSYVFEGNLQIVAEDEAANDT